MISISNIEPRHRVNETKTLYVCVCLCLCVSFIITIDISHTDLQQIRIVHFASREKHAKPACTFSVASQTLQYVVLLCHINVSSSCKISDPNHEK